MEDIVSEDQKTFICIYYAIINFLTNVVLDVMTSLCSII